MLRLKHPFFERLRDLRSVFCQFDAIETEHFGAAQDWEIELQMPGRRRTPDYDEDEALIEHKYNSVLVQTMHRQCQIIMLDSTFESLCKETGARKKPEENLVLSRLERAEREGMQSSVWPQHRNSIEVFVKLRRHLVHEGLEATDDLLKGLDPIIGSVDEFPGACVAEKIAWLRERRSLVAIPRSFVASILAKLDELGAALLIPVDSEYIEPPFDPSAFLGDPASG